MAKTKNKLQKTCEQCIHERVCEMWCDGRSMAPGNATTCYNYEPLKDSNAYFIGFREGSKIEKGAIK